MTCGTVDRRGQIKTRDRVRALAEVYTHEREVHAMLDLIPDMFPNTAAGTELKFLEPACGSGNFLEEILHRKFAAIRFNRIKSVAGYEHRLLRALASIYDVDICSENVREARSRILSTLRAHYYDDANASVPTDGFVSASRTILETNIVCADMLTQATTTQVVDYQAGSGGTFTRVWSMLYDAILVEQQSDLFSSALQQCRDKTPVHYTELASTPEPARSVSISTSVKRA